MTQIFTIESDKVVIATAALSQTLGNVNHTGDLSVSGTLTVEKLIVTNPETTPTLDTNVGNWIGIQEEEINGKGLSWTWGQGGANLVYRDGNRIWSDADIDLDASRSYKINNIPVISAGSLGPTITKSNIKEVGALKNLAVIGDTVLSEFAYFNSGFGRLGLNTNEPNGILSVVDFDSEFIVGSLEIGKVAIGTYTNHDLSIITDSTERVLIKNNGETTFNGDVKINGTLNVETIISDTRIDRYSPIEFKSTRDTAIYGNGLVWTGTGTPRQFIMMAGPDRLWSSESLDLAPDQSYYINNSPVLSETTIGERVVNSSLTKVGVLESLMVGGETRLFGNLKADTVSAEFKSSTFTDHQGHLNISSTGIVSRDNFTVSVGTDEIVYADTNEISIGNKSNTRRPVKVYGPLSVGVSTPDPEVDLAVKGSISFSNKKFITGDAAPSQGTYSKGDVCWNNNPQADNYVGWICVADGAPGVWLPFGAIANQ